MWHQESSQEEGSRATDLQKNHATFRDMVKLIKLPFLLLHC